jgi:ATP-dependent Clp protease ATP-binding subunit ClpA
MLNKHLPDKALDIIDEACARKSTMQQKLNNDGSFKKAEKKINKIKDQIEEAIEIQDYFQAAELKELEEKAKNEIFKIRNKKNVPTHLRPTIGQNDV